MELFYENTCGKIIHGDNLEYLKTMEADTVDSCVSDFPYDLAFMGRKWDATGDFYSWCKARAVELLRVMKPGGYACIFGHPKTNHRMKCAFEDAGFNIVDEIDWIYLTGMPKGQDIGKLFEKKEDIEQAEKWEGWKTAGLKPAHEPITIFQKPLKGTYIQNIEKYGCGAMNIDVCRIPVNPELDDPRLGGRGTWSTTKAAENVYSGGYAGERVGSSELGRFPPNVIMDENVAAAFDVDLREQGGSEVGSRGFPIIRYCAKISPSERMLPNGERNPHVTVKPVDLIKWLIKLVTPKDGFTVDITAGSCTHAVACEELNREGYALRYVDIELQNTEVEPYCAVGKMRVQSRELWI